jgi:hypothetical protein
MAVEPWQLQILPSPASSFPVGRELFHVGHDSEHVIKNSFPHTVLGAQVPDEKVIKCLTFLSCEMMAYVAYTKPHKKTSRDHMQNIFLMLLQSTLSSPILR